MDDTSFLIVDNELVVAQEFEHDARDVRMIDVLWKMQDESEKWFPAIYAPNKGEVYHWLLFEDGSAMAVNLKTAKWFDGTTKKWKKLIYKQTDSIK